MSGNTVLALALFAGSSSAAFTNVTHMATATIAFGSTASEDGVNSFFPGSNGGASGVFERGSRKKPEIDEEQVKELHAKIGELAVANSFLERKLKP